MKILVDLYLSLNVHRHDYVGSETDPTCKSLIPQHSRLKIKNGRARAQCMRAYLKHVVDEHEGSHAVSHVIAPVGQSTRARG